MAFHFGPRKATVAFGQHKNSNKKKKMLNKKLFLALALSSLACLCTASYPGYIHSQLLEIIVPDVPVADFQYSPTLEGYKFNYRLVDGRYHEESAYLVDPNSSEAAAYIMNEAIRRSMPRPKGTKNRKLSPKSLQSLAG